MIKVRLWVHDDYVEIYISEKEYPKLISWANRNEIDVYKLG